eukprot:6551295-Prymnesium_polylepis.1
MTCEEPPNTTRRGSRHRRRNGRRLQAAPARRTRLNMHRVRGQPAGPRCCVSACAGGRRDCLWTLAARSVRRWPVTD